MSLANLLLNPTFGLEKYNQTPFDISGMLPRDWHLTAYSKPGDPKLDKQDQDWAQPEIIPIKWGKQFLEWQLVYGATGATDTNLMPVSIDPFILKVFKGSAPTFASFSQTIDVPAGAYRFRCPIYPDQKQGGSSRPSPASSDDWYLASEARIFIGNIKTEWMDARIMPIGRYTAWFIECNHLGGLLTIGFDLRGRWGFQNNGWFIDECSLVRLDDAPTTILEPALSIRELAQFTLKSTKAAMLDAQAVVDALMEESK